MAFCLHVKLAELFAWCCTVKELTLEKRDSIIQLYVEIALRQCFEKHECGGLTVLSH